MSIKTKVLNCPVDVCTVEEAIDCAKSTISNGKNFQIVTINPEMIMFAQKNKEFLDILSSSNFNIVDGIGVRIALKFQNINAHRIRGIDFARKLIEFADKNNLSLGLLGAKKEVIEKTLENIKQKYPNLNVVYTQDGYFDDEDKIIEQIKTACPKVLLVGLGSPKQEKIIMKLKDVLSSSIMIGVGGSFDVLSGYVKESPIFFRKLGLEWLYRTVMQPERFKRIFPTLPIFLLMCIMDSIKKGIKN